MPSRCKVQTSLDERTGLVFKRKAAELNITPYKLAQELIEVGLSNPEFSLLERFRKGLVVLMRELETLP